MKDWKISTALASIGVTLIAASAQAKEIAADDLLNLSLEQLSNIEVTSVSKRSEKASEAAAAIFVVTQDDIRHSGATSIPEALRMVPGLNVAQSGAHQWAITSRGFNDQFANKLLVLIDGRSVYTPLFSGVHWDVQDTMLEDIERIEVIRGPGATLWGANAVNGVINIITKSARDTEGALAAVSIGNQEHGLVRARQGVKVDDNTYVRAYAKYDDRDEAHNMAGADAGDAWNKAQAGFRADWSSSEKRSYTLQGDVYRGGENNILNLPTIAPGFNTVNDRDVVRGGNVLGRWTEKLENSSEITAQMYGDLARRENIVSTTRISTLDLDIQHVWNPAAGHEVVWGGGYRYVHFDTRGLTYIQFADSKVSDSLFSAFAQDKIALVDDKLFFTVGSKFERNEYTGFEFQPSGRLSWIINDKQTLWGSVSRAVHTPDRGTSADSQLIVASQGAGVFLARVGNNALDSETMIAYEAGYRIQPANNLSFDAAAFYNDYENLILGAFGTPYVQVSPLGAYLVVPVLPINTGSAHTWGGELSTKWNPYSNWELSAGYSFLKLEFDQADPFGFSFAGKSPEQQINVGSTIYLPHNLELSNAVYYVDALKGLGIHNYVRVDARLAWKPVENIELSITGQNLIDNEHPEFSAFLSQNASQIPRSVYGNITWKF